LTTVATRVRRISDLEEFDIQVLKDGALVDTTENGVLRADYPFDRKLKHTKTVSEWIKERFEQTYPGFTCQVLKGDGTIAAPQTSLRTVRESYEEDPDDEDVD
jgi:hypothetical protein